MQHCLDAVVGEKVLALASSVNSCDSRVAHTCTAPLCQAALSSRYHAPARAKTRKSCSGHEKLASCLSHSFLFSILFDTRITLKFPFKQHLCSALYARAFEHVPGPGFRRWNMLCFHCNNVEPKPEPELLRKSSPPCAPTMCTTVTDQILTVAASKQPACAKRNNVLSAPAGGQSGIRQAHMQLLPAALTGPAVAERCSSQPTLLTLT